MRTVNFVFSAIVKFLLILLGFSACSDNGPDDNRVEYGTPSARYKVRGNTVDETTKDPIEGLRAVFYSGYKDAQDELRVVRADTVYTDDKGVFEATLREFAGEFHLRIDDVDGEDNGLYVQQDTALDFSDEKFTGGSGWYHGEATKDLGEILMEVEEPEEPIEPIEPVEPEE